MQTVADAHCPDEYPHTPPARFDSGQPCAGGAESRLAQPSRSDAVGGLDAVPDALDCEPMAEGAGPQPRSALDLDDTSRCPVAPGCETCQAVDDLDVATLDTPVGVACATLCGSCAMAGDLPRYASWSEAVCRVGLHCEHLGTDVDTASAARR